MINGGGPQLMYDLPPGPGGQPLLGDVAALANTVPAPAPDDGTGGTTPVPDTSAGATPPPPAPTGGVTPQPPGPGATLPPPTPSAPGGPISPTMADVHSMMEQMPATYQKMLDITMAAHDKNMRQHLPEPQHGLGWWLGNIASLGTAGLVQNDYRTAYNAGIDASNQRERGKAIDEAKDLMNAQMQAVAAGANFNWKLIEYQTQQQQRQFENWAKMFGIGQDVTKTGLELNRPFSQEEQDAITEHVRSTFGPNADWRSTKAGVRNIEIYDRRTGNILQAAPPVMGMPGAGGGGGQGDINWGAGGGGGGGGTGAPAPGPKSGGPPAVPANATPPGPAQPSNVSGHMTPEERAVQKGQQATTQAVTQQENLALGEMKTHTNAVRALIDSPTWKEAVNLLPSSGGKPGQAYVGREINKYVRLPLLTSVGAKGTAYLKHAADVAPQAIAAYTGSTGRAGRVQLPALGEFGEDFKRLANGDMSREEEADWEKTLRERLDQIDGVYANPGKYITGPGAGAGAGTAGGAGGGGGGAPGNILRGNDALKYLQSR